MKCAKCGAEYEGNFCPNCGAKTIYCTNCGAPMVVGQKFCKQCGVRVAESIEVVYQDEDDAMSDKTGFNDGKTSKKMLIVKVVPLFAAIYGALTLLVFLNLDLISTSIGDITLTARMSCYEALGLGIKGKDLAYDIALIVIAIVILIVGFLHFLYMAFNVSQYNVSSKYIIKINNRATIVEIILMLGEVITGILMAVLISNEISELNSSTGSIIDYNNFISVGAGVICIIAVGSSFAVIAIIMHIISSHFVKSHS